jgi:hypothetical protein
MRLGLGLPGGYARRAFLGQDDLAQFAKPRGALDRRQL